MSSSATTTVGDRAPFQQFASGFGRASAVLSALALLVAVGLSVPASWFSFLGDEPEAAASYGEIKPSEPVRLAVAGLDVVTPLVASDLTRAARSPTRPPTRPS